LIDNLKQTKEKNIYRQLMRASQYMVVGESSKAVKIVQNILDNNASLSVEVEECFRLMFLKLDAGFNVKLHYMNKLLHSDSSFKFFVARDLARLALEEKSYHYSLEFSLIAFDINDQDADLLELLIDVYATLESWTKMGEIVEKLRGVDKNKFESVKTKISTHYLKSAKHFIGLGELEDSVFYLKKCLEYKPDFFKCIELISNIHLESKEIDLKSIIENAFAISPSFELFIIYYQNYKSFMMSADIYSRLVGLINKNKNKELVIAIAYFLNMKQELDQIVLPII
jgi:tetratricopeptide (TPR) repeat protein